MGSKYLKVAGCIYLRFARVLSMQFKLRRKSLGRFEREVALWQMQVTFLRVVPLVVAAGRLG